MRYSGLSALCLTMLLMATFTNAASGGVLGVFQGTIVKSWAGNSGSQEHWVYVQSRSGSVRKVNIAQALVEYDENVPARMRHKNPLESVRLAAEVRITAEQDRSADGSGDWQAKRVLILAKAIGKERSTPTHGVTTTLKKRA